MQVSGQLHTPATLSLGYETMVPIQIGDWVGPKASLDEVAKRSG